MEQQPQQQPSTEQQVIVGATIGTVAKAAWPGLRAWFAQLGQAFSNGIGVAIGFLLIMFE